MLKTGILFLSLSLLTVCQAVAQTRLTEAEMKQLYTKSTPSCVSIHDPSVVYRDGTFYIWGSHLGVGMSKDLVNFTGLSADARTFARPDGTLCDFRTAFNTQAVKQVTDCTGQVTDFPQIDAEAWCSWYASDKETWINGDMWAPDIVYNETMKKWCMYLSLNGDNWASVIILLTAPTATGPFTYQGPVVMSGFTNGTHNNIKAPSYENTDMQLALGPLSALPSRYAQQGHWGTYWPNCIDPCAFFDEDGELWLAYGSWSGGIFMLKLDKEIGLRDYTYTYPSDYAEKGASGVSDPYFGKKIAGGYYVSGEGPYIQHIGSHYYLFMSYGGFAPGGYIKNPDGSYQLDGNGNKIPEGGYEMRVFRSENPDGPYVDAAGQKATYTGYQMNYGPTAATDRGLKLVGAYNNWGNQTVGECAQGHNSACVDDAGRAYVVYHTKFNDGTYGHQVRVHQLFVNEKGWLVAAPFCYAGETTTDADIASETLFTADEVAGTYHFMRHPYRLNFGEFEETVPSELTLSPDGKVTGAYTGTWSIREGTAYLTLKLGTTFYYGVLTEQHVNGSTAQNFQTTSLKAIAFSAVASNGVPVWGYKLEEPYAVAYNYLSNTIPVKDGVSCSRNIRLMFPTTDNTTLAWTSSHPDIIDETGKYNPPSEMTPVELTGRLSCGEYFWEQSYTVRAQAETTPSGDYLGGLVAYYNMDETPCYNAYDTSQRMMFAATGVKPKLVTDYERFGKVLQQSFGVLGSNSATRMPNPLKNATDIDGFTVSMWVKRTDSNAWDALWGFFNSTQATSGSARLFLTGNSYLGYNNNAGTWFDVNHPDKGLYSDIPVGEWALVTVTVGTTNGVRIYVNGRNKTTHSVATDGGTSTAKNLPDEAVLATVKSLNYFYLGQGSFWGSADCCIDDVMIYNRELSSADVSALNTMCNRVTDFTKGEGGTAIDGIPSAARPEAEGTVYDLCGRRLSAPAARSLKKGLYIVNGRKILVK